jgi:hypothetical protein
MSNSPDTGDLPPDLAKVLRDPSVIVAQDSAVFELIATWMSAPALTASAALVTLTPSEQRFEAVHSSATTPAASV